MPLPFPRLSDFGVTNFEIAPPKNTGHTLKQRHPLSDPNETHRKSEMQCQRCYKSKAAGVTLFRCGACKTDFYCSKECQKAAWPSHRDFCKEKQAGLSTFTADEFSNLKILRAFTSKHRPTVCEATMRALDLEKNPSNALRSFLLIELHSRLDAKRMEQRFYVTGAAAVTYDKYLTLWPLQALDMVEKIKALYEQQRAAGMGGAFFVVWAAVDLGLFNITGTVFEEGAYHSPTIPVDVPWKEGMAERLNEGIVS